MISLKHMNKKVGNYPYFSNTSDHFKLWIHPPTTASDTTIPYAPRSPVTSTRGLCLVDRTGLSIRSYPNRRERNINRVPMNNFLSRLICSAMTLSADSPMLNTCGPDAPSPEVQPLTHILNFMWNNLLCRTINSPLDRALWQIPWGVSSYQQLPRSASYRAGWEIEIKIRELWIGGFNVIHRYSKHTLIRNTQIYIYFPPTLKKKLYN